MPRPGSSTRDQSPLRSEEPDTLVSVVDSHARLMKRRAPRLSSLAAQRLLGRRPGNSGSFAWPIDRDVEAMLESSDCGRLFLEHEGSAIHKWVHYFEIYSRELAPVRHGFPLPDGSRRQLRFLEIGVSHGGSLELWRRYLGPDATIFGIDVDPRCAKVDDRVASVRIGSQTDAAFLRSVVDEMGGLDVVIDDGSHQAHHQRKTLDVLFPLLADGGLYVVEDVHTAYWSNFGGGLRRRGSWIETVKAVIDDMHVPYHGHSTAVLSSDSGAFRVTAYDSITVIEKRPASRPKSIRTGRPRW